MRFTYILARELGMSRRRLLQEMDSRELAHWQALYLLEARERDKAQKAAELNRAAQGQMQDIKRRLKNGRSR